MGAGDTWGLHKLAILLGSEWSWTVDAARGVIRITHEGGLYVDLSDEVVWDAHVTEVFWGAVAGALSSASARGMTGACWVTTDQVYGEEITCTVEECNWRLK